MEDSVVSGLELVRFAQSRVQGVARGSVDDSGDKITAHSQADVLDDGQQYDRLLNSRLQQLDHRLSRPFVAKIKDLYSAEWRADLDLAVLATAPGKFWQYMGFETAGVKYLFWQEALMLCDMGCMVLTVESGGHDGTRTLSMQESVELLLRGRASRERQYRVYAHLTRLGCRPLVRSRRRRRVASTESAARRRSGKSADVSPAHKTAACSGTTMTSSSSLSCPVSATESGGRAGDGVCGEWPQYDAAMKSCVAGRRLPSDFLRVYGLAVLSSRRSSRSSAAAGSVVSDVSTASVVEDSCHTGHIEGAACVCETVSVAAAPASLWPPGVRPRPCYQFSVPSRTTRPVTSRLSDAVWPCDHWTCKNKMLADMWRVGDGRSPRSCLLASSCLQRRQLMLWLPVATVLQRIRLAPSTLPPSSGGAWRRSLRPRVIYHVYTPPGASGGGSGGGSGGVGDIGTAFRKSSPPAPTLRLAVVRADSWMRMSQGGDPVDGDQESDDEDDDDDQEEDGQLSVAVLADVGPPAIYTVDFGTIPSVPHC